MNLKISCLALACASLVLVAASPPDARALWQKANERARALAREGRYQLAEAAYKEALDQARKLGGDDPRLAASLTDLGQYYRSQAQYRQAEPLLAEALAIRTRQGQAGRLEAAKISHALANLYRAQGEFDRAAPLYKQSLQLAESALGPGHPDLAAFAAPAAGQGEGESRPALALSLLNLADLYRAQGRNDEAESLYKRALAQAESQPDQPTIGLCLNNLADLYAATERAAEAEPLYERALAIATAASPGDRPVSTLFGTTSEAEITDSATDYATALNNLADFRRATGRQAEAEKLYRQALAFEESRLGRQHPALCPTLNNLADLYESEGRTKEAAPLRKRADDIRYAAFEGAERDIETYRQALAIDEKALGSWHPDIATDLSNIADVYRAQGRYNEAEPLYKRALAVAEASHGPHHPCVAASLNNLADIYQAQGKYSLAEPLFKRSLSLTEKLAKVEHPYLADREQQLAGRKRQVEAKLATGLNDLADYYRASGRYSDAEPLYWKALALSESAFAVGDPRAAVTLNNLADMYRQQGRTAEAEPLYTRALSIRRRGQSPRADMTWAIALSEEAAGANELDLAQDLSALADLYAGEKRYSQADSLYRQSLAIYERMSGKDHPDTLAIVERYSRLLSAAGRKAEAQALDARLRQSRSRQRG